jgi:archaellum component FlaC
MNKNKYITKMIVNLDGKKLPIGSPLELTPIAAKSLIAAKAIELVEGGVMLIDEMEAEELIGKQAETIRLLNESLDKALKAKDEIEGALLKSKAEFSDLNKKYEGSVSKINELQTKIDELESQRQAKAKPAKKTDEK